MAAWRFARLAVLVLLAAWFAAHVAEASDDLRALGPQGGDVRRLAYAPDNPLRVFLGTSSGRLYVSDDGGAKWTPFAHLGQGFDYVLDNILIDPRSPRTMYVGAWSIERNTGELFRTRDGGRTWTSLKGMQGQSIRSLAMSPSNSQVLAAGTLEGVFRSNDGGETWKQISPPNHPDIKNIQSVALDPRDPSVVYAGTWHLAWKTGDGGATWKQINRGMIDDSDVFSIIVDPQRPAVVYASACSGIYKSETAGELFSKVQGIPFSARRTRVLKQDPNRPDVVYAGTTEGLWRTTDAGRHWLRISAANIIVNDVMVDPRNSANILLATDRSGVLASHDDGHTFTASNTGFSHRQVTSILVDRSDPRVVYAGVVNDKEFGGVFVSRDAGGHWEQLNRGLGGEDVFTLGQDRSGQLYAGTNRGLFRFSGKSRLWMRIYPVARAQAFQVNALSLEGKNWIAAGPRGISHSRNSGTSWTVVRNPSSQPFLAVHMVNDLVVAATHDLLLTSTDGGATWERMHLPAVSYIRSMVVDNDARVWITSPQGAFIRQTGGTWVHVRGLAEDPLTLAYEQRGRRVLALTPSHTVFATADGESWERVVGIGVPAKTLVVDNGQLLAGTTFDGVLSYRWNRREVADSLGGGAHR
jgi:photosystem II stability/assembly factor-like uncharacterized protein